VGQYAKDLGVALEVAGRRGLRLEMSTQARQLWDGLRDAGHEQDDYTRIAPILAAAAGLPWPTPRAAVPGDAQPGDGCQP